MQVISSIVGEPLPVEKVTNPTERQLDELHARYLERLMDLYKKFSPLYGRKVPLVFS